MWYIRQSNICFHHHNMTSACQHDREIAHRRRVFVEFKQILIQDINIFKMWQNLANQRPQILTEMVKAAKIKAGLVVCSGAIFNYVTMADSGDINSGHEPNSVQCLFERRTLVKVKELGPDQPDGLIYCEELFVELCAAPPQKLFSSRHWSDRCTDSNNTTSAQQAKQRQIRTSGWEMTDLKSGIGYNVKRQLLYCRCM